MGRQTTFCSIVCCVVLLMFLKQLSGQVIFGCQKDACARQHNSCPDLKCYTGRIVKNATNCGCCHICVTKLEKDDPCLDLITAAIPRQECGPGLECVDKTCKLVEGSDTCTKKLADFERDAAGQEITTGPPKPKCDQFGEFEPVQCKPGMLCHCVDRKGKPIFGLAPYTTENDTNCLCSRNLVELKESKVFEEDMAYLRCTGSGDYDEPQCTETQCYCINKTGDTLSLPVDRRNGSIALLPCYKRNLHSPNFETPCLLEKERLEVLKKNASKSGITVLGLESPSCDPDGSYGPKQCRENKCYCVNKQGLRYVDKNNQVRYTVDRYSEEANTMRCNCEREKELLRHIPENKVTDIFASYKCDQNGNYLPMQCTTSVCYCLDGDGYQTSGKATIVADRKQLRCHIDEYDSILGILD